MLVTITYGILRYSYVMAHVSSTVANIQNLAELIAKKTILYVTVLAVYAASGMHE